MKKKTNLDLIADTDRFPWVNENEDEDHGSSTFSQLLRQQGLYTLVWQDESGQYGIGYVPDRVIQELYKIPREVRGEIEVNEQDKTISIFNELSTEGERTRMVADVSSYWRRNGTFKLLKGWRNELWPVYDRHGGLLFSMERAAMGLLGTMRYGVHMIAYVEDPTAPYGIKLWVPRRAADKSTFPGMLDNTVAGGLMTGEDPFECMIREADEEASLPDSVVRNNAVCTGNVTYIYVTESKQVGEDGFIYPECEWVYDLKLPAHVIPQPKDGEVEEFMLRDVNEVKRDLGLGKFKPNCALITINFFIRRGILTEENEPDLAAIKRRMHRKMPFPGPHQSEWCTEQRTKG